ncbi:MAG: glutamyl-tRNA reductase [Bacteroidia bacterium]|nr:glutamyl-tRNA reductase [Bacteroidia bacterium]
MKFYPADCIFASQLKMDLSLKTVSLSHHKAPVEIRELIYIRPAAIRDLMLSLKDIFNTSELLVLSTCNRTEVYYVSESDLSSGIIARLLCEKGLSQVDQYLPYFDILDGEQALQHLFEVAMGLRSGIIGDIQITHQVKEAYSISHELNLAGPVLHRLLHTIFHAGKRVQSETGYRDGAASVSYAAVETAEISVGDPESARVLVVGLGEMGADVARNLRYSSFRQVHLMNRTIEKAHELSAETGFPVIPFDQLESVLSQFDVVFSAVSGMDCLITRPLLERDERHAHRYFFDLSVPRSIAADAEEVAGVIVFNIDEIQSRASEVLERRLQFVPAVQQIIREEMGGFKDWSRELSISPTIHLLKDALENLRKEEISRYLKNLNEKELEAVEEVTRSLMQKVMKLPVLNLKEACRRGDADSLIEALHTIFNLDKSRVKTEK